MIIKGKLIKCDRKVKEFKGKAQPEKLYLTLAEVEKLDKEIVNAFAESGKTFTPEWVKEFEGFVNLSTQYDLPCRDLKDKEYDSVLDFITDENFPWMGAEVGVSVNVKKGAVYPKSIKFYSEGKEFNAFSEFDNEK